MKQQVLDPVILENFKQVISDNDDFLIKKYSNFEGKNKMGAILSAKDWLHVVVYGLPFIDLYHENQDAQSLNVLQFVCTIDLLSEAIQQLYRVIFNVKNYPLFKDKTVFNKETSDDRYFAHIRAAFGAHAVNLEDRDGNQQKRYFASWSSSHGEGDLSVYLYSNDPNEDYQKLVISFDQLFDYARKRYLCLNDISKEIENQYLHFKEKCINTPILRSVDVLEQLYILRDENVARIGRDGYSYDIETLIKLYTAPMMFPSELDIYKGYLNKIRQSVTDIYNNLQMMNVVDLSVYPSPSYSRVENLKQYFYDIQKIHEYLGREAGQEGSLEVMIQYHLNRLITVEILPPFADKDLDKRDLMLLLYTHLEENGAPILTENDNLEPEEAPPVDIKVVFIDDIE